MHCFGCEAEVACVEDDEPPGVTAADRNGHIELNSLLRGGAWDYVAGEVFLKRCAADAEEARGRRNISKLKYALLNNSSRYLHSHARTMMSVPNSILWAPAGVRWQSPVSHGM